MRRHLFRPLRSPVFAALVLGGVLSPVVAGAESLLVPGIKSSPKMQMSIGGGATREEALEAEREAVAARAAASAAAASKDKGHAKGARAVAAASAPVDPMERLRERLAEKLGAQPAEGGKNKYVMKVSTHGESGETTISSPRPSANAVAAATRRADGARAQALLDGHDPHGAPAGAASHGGPAHWSYAGDSGPEAWARMNPEWASCGAGTRQSPIDIRGGIPVDLEPVKFDYRPSGFGVIDNGHTVQVNVAPGNSIQVMGRRFDLVQFHFHRPSEERIDGRQFDMVAHLVHKDPDGKLAVVAVLLDRGSANPIVQSVWNNLPLEKGEELHAPTTLDLSRLLPDDRRYYTYMGSLTTPPCSEGVLWMVLKQPLGISPEQVGIFSRLYPNNARPIQQAAGRLIKESN